MNKLRSILYQLARLIGDLNSFRSPAKFVKRQGRKVVLKGIGKRLWK